MGSKSMSGHGSGLQNDTIENTTATGNFNFHEEYMPES